MIRTQVNDWSNNICKQRNIAIFDRKDFLYPLSKFEICFNVELSNQIRKVDSRNYFRNRKVNVENKTGIL